MGHRWITLTQSTSSVCLKLSLASLSLPFPSAQSASFCSFHRCHLYYISPHSRFFLTLISHLDDLGSYRGNQALVPKVSKSCPQSSWLLKFMVVPRLGSTKRSSDPQMCSYSHYVTSALSLHHKEMYIVIFSLHIFGEKFPLSIYRKISEPPSQ